MDEVLYKVTFLQNELTVKKLYLKVNSKSISNTFKYQSYSGTTFVRESDIGVVSNGTVLCRHESEIPAALRLMLQKNLIELEWQEKKIRMRKDKIAKLEAAIEAGGVK